MSKSDVLDWLTASICHGTEDVHLADSQKSRGLPGSEPAILGTFGWLPLEDGRGYLVPLHSRRVASGALDNLYNPQSLKARVAKALLAAGLRLGFGSRLLPRVQIVLRGPHRGEGPLLLEYLKDVLGRDDLSVAIALGTPGFHRKPVLVVVTAKGAALAYVKLGSNAATDTLIQHETRVLEHLGSKTFHTFTVPLVLHADSWNGRYMCIQSALDGKTRPPSSIPVSRYLDISRELAATHLQWRSLEDSGFWEELMTRIDASSNDYCRSVLERGIRKAEDWSRGSRVPFYFSHGDFTPWNVKLNDDRIVVFDWEYARQDGLPGRDVFHFIFQTMRFLRKYNPQGMFDVVLKDLQLRARVRMHLADLGLTDIPQEFCLLLYGLERIATIASVNPSNAALHLEVQSLANFLRSI